MPSTASVSVCTLRMSEMKKNMTRPKPAASAIRSSVDALYGCARQSATRKQSTMTKATASCMIEPGATTDKTPTKMSFFITSTSSQKKKGRSYSPVRKSSAMENCVSSSSHTALRTRKSSVA